MRYERAPDLEEKLKDIINVLGIDYVNTERVACFRSYGTNSRRVIARCHGLPKVMQLGMNIDAFYVIEVLSERFERMSEEEKTKVLIHELLHIPKSFGGGFRQHDFVNRRTVDRIYDQYKRLKENGKDNTENAKCEENKENEEKTEKATGIIEQFMQTFAAKKDE